MFSGWVFASAPRKAHKFAVKLEVKNILLIEMAMNNRLLEIIAVRYALQCSCVVFLGKSPRRGRGRGRG